MPDLAHIDVDELRSRMEEILTRVEGVFVEIGPAVKLIGNLREEAALIYDELSRRGLPVAEETPVVDPV